MMNETEKLIKILADKEELYKKHLKISKSKKSKAIVKAIREATYGTFVGENGSSTLMGWIPMYDKKGRPINADPNHKTSYVYINGCVYSLNTCEWHCEIWEVDPVFKKKLRFIAEVDFRPIYVKRYDAKIAKERKGKYVKPSITVKQLVNIDGTDYIMTKWNVASESKIITVPYIMQEQCKTIGLESLDDTAKKLVKEIIEKGKTTEYYTFNIPNEGK